MRTLLALTLFYSASCAGTNAGAAAPSTTPSKLVIVGRVLACVVQAFATPVPVEQPAAEAAPAADRTSPTP